MRRVLVWMSMLAMLGCGDDKKSDDGGDGTPDGADGSGDGTGDGTGDGADGSGDGTGDGGSDGADDSFDCTALTTYYTASCPDHVEIADDLTACALIQAGADEKPFVATRAAAAAICAEAATDCDKILLCVEDLEGLNATSTNTSVTGQASYDGETFPIAVENAWAVLGTKKTGEAGNLVVLFHVDGKPWYFKLNDFAPRAEENPFVVDLERPVKLENANENLEIASGTVTVTAFARDGAFDIRASVSDAATGEAIDLTVKGTFTPAE